MLITVDVLRAHNACTSQVELFDRTFMGGCTITLAVLRKARKAGLGVGWIARLLPPDIRSVYDAAMDEAQKVYYAAMDEARKVYYAAMDRALVASFRKMDKGAKQYPSDLEREADVALAEEVFGCLVSDSNRVHLDDDVAIGMLEDGDRIHVFVGGVGNAIIGADWKRQDVIDFIRANHAELSGPGATAIGHGIASGDGRKWTFFKTKEMSE
jgi:hypothetical protein